MFPGGVLGSVEVNEFAHARNDTNADGEKNDAQRYLSVLELYRKKYSEAELSSAMAT